MNKLPLALFLLSVVMLAGCHHHHKKKQQLPTSAPVPVTEVQEQKLTPPPVPRMPVMQGPTPLAYMVDSGGLVQIVEAGSSTVLAQSVASPRSIVSVDDNAGIRISGQLIVKGPLPPGRTYQIFVDNTGKVDNTWKTEVVKPGTH